MQIGRGLSAAVALCLAACATTQPQAESWPTPVKAPTTVAATPAPVPHTPQPDAAAPFPAASTATTPPAAVGEASGTAAKGAAEPQTLVGLKPAQYPDLLDRMRAGFQLDDVEERAIDSQLNWYASNPAYLERVFGRAELYLYHIAEEVEARGIPAEIALLPVVESAFEPFAFSHSNASGLWQFIADTGRRYGLRQTWWYDGRRDVLESTRAALDYLQFMHDEFNGDWLLAVAGYNCGENCVARAVRATKAAGQPVDFWNVRMRLPAETRAYVPKLLAMKRLIANPEDYGIEFSPIANEPYFTRVDTNGQIELKLAAQLAGITQSELSELNPAFHRWATPPDGPNHLLLPIDTADTFRENVSQLTPDELMRVVHYEVKPRETLDSIARRFNTQPHVIRELNALGNGSLVVGTDLRVPSGMTELPEKVARAAARVDRRTAGGGIVRRGARRPNIHVVRRGDTLWAVARRNGMDVRTLMRLNSMRPGRQLRAGEKLVVSNSSAGSRGSSGNRGNEQSGTQDRASKRSSATSRYTVKRGDTLYSIARRHNVSVSELASWNGLTTQTHVRAGQKLAVNPKRR